MNKYLYIGAIVGGSILTLFFAMLAGSPHTTEMAAALPFPILLVVVFHVMLVYKMWAALQSGVHRTTPGKAAGLLFVPLYNIYWLFNVYVGFAKDFNSTIAQRNTPYPRLNENLFIANCVLILLAVPVVNWIVAALTISKIVDAIDHLNKR